MKQQAVVKQFKVRIDASLHYAIKKICFDRNMSINDWALLVLVEAVRKEHELMKEK